MKQEIMDFLLAKTPEIYERKPNLFKESENHRGWFSCRAYFLEQNDLFLNEALKELEKEYPGIYDKEELFYMQKLYLMYPKEPPEDLLCLSWEHIKLLLNLCEEQKRNFYIELCLQKNLSVKDLKKYLLEDLYEKCLLANKERRVYQRDYSKMDELISVSKMVWS